MFAYIKSLAGDARCIKKALSCLFLIGPLEQLIIAQRKDSETQSNEVEHYCREKVSS